MAARLGVLRILSATTKMLPSRLPASTRLLSTHSVAMQRYYTKEHEWIDVNEKIGRVGITNYAQDNLGELVYVELPEVDTEYDTEDTAGTVESVKAASDILNPVTGTVVAVNEVLAESPSLVNSSPEQDGWIYDIEMTDPSELDELMDKEQYDDFLASDSA